MYPLEPQFPNILQARGFKRGIGKTAFRTKVVPLAFALARIMNEVKWEDRLDPYNHHPFFPVGVTTVWDTAPIYVATPSDSRINRLLYQPGVCSGPKSINICVQLPGECPKFITLACAGGCVNDVCDFGGFPIP